VRRYSEEIAHRTLDETASIFVSSAEVYPTNQSLLADVDASSWTSPQDGTDDNNAGQADEDGLSIDSKSYLHYNIAAPLDPRD